jgi:glycerol 3-phosphate dehydrogenase (NAD(P)+) (EC 1.1.1.94)
MDFPVWGIWSLHVRVYTAVTVKQATWWARVILCSRRWMRSRW